MDEQLLCLKVMNGERRKDQNTSGQPGNKFNNSCRDISVKEITPLVTGVKSYI